MGFFEEWDCLLEPAGILVVDPEIGHGRLRIRVLAAELGLLPLEHLFEPRDGFVEPLYTPVACREAVDVVVRVSGWSGQSLATSYRASVSSNRARALGSLPLAR